MAVKRGWPLKRVIISLFFSPKVIARVVEGLGMDTLICYGNKLQACNKLVQHE